MSLKNAISTSIIRYPYVATEIICSDIPFINDYLLGSENDEMEKIKSCLKAESDEDIKVEDFNDSNTEKNKMEIELKNNAEISTVDTQIQEKPIQRLFKIFEEPNVNAVNAGYFSKILIHLLTKNTNEVNDFIFNSPELWGALIECCDSSSIDDVLTKLLNVEPMNGEIDDPYLSHKMQTVRMLINKMDPIFSEEANIGACKVLMEHLQNKIVSDVLIESESLLKFKTQTLNGTNSSFRCALRLLISYIDLEKRKYIHNDESIKKIETLVLELISPLCEKLKECCQHKYYWNNQQNIKCTALGMANQRIIEFIDSIIRLNKISILTLLNKCGAFTILINFIGIFYSNTNAHILIFAIFKYCAQDAHLCKDIIIQNDIAGLMYGLHSDRTGVFQSGRTFIKPYHTHLMSLAQLIEKKRNTMPYLDEYLQSKLLIRN